MAQDRTSELGEEAFDEVEPGAVLGCEGELEASRGSSVEPSSGFSRYVGGMIIEDQLDRGAGRISGVEKLDTLPDPGTLFDDDCDRRGSLRVHGRLWGWPHPHQGEDRDALRLLNKGRPSFSLLAQVKPLAASQQRSRISVVG